MVGERERREPEARPPRHQLLGVRGAVEEAEVGVGVQLGVAARGSVIGGLHPPAAPLHRAEVRPAVRRRAAGSGPAAAGAARSHHRSSSSHGPAQPRPPCPGRRRPRGVGRRARAGRGELTSTGCSARPHHLGRPAARGAPAPGRAGGGGPGQGGLVVCGGRLLPPGHERPRSAGARPPEPAQPVKTASGPSMPRSRSRPRTARRSASETPPHRPSWRPPRRHHLARRAGARARCRRSGRPRRRPGQPALELPAQPLDHGLGTERLLAAPGPATSSSPCSVIGLDARQRAGQPPLVELAHEVVGTAPRRRTARRSTRSAGGSSGLACDSSSSSTERRSGRCSPGPAANRCAGRRRGRSAP